MAYHSKASVGLIAVLKSTGIGLVFDDFDFSSEIVESSFRTMAKCTEIGAHDTCGRG